MKVELSITDAQTISEYEENGVCVVRNVLDPEWIARMGDATDRILANPSPGSMEYTPEGKTGRYYGDFFIWRRDPDFNDFMRAPPRCPGWRRNSCRLKSSVFSMLQRPLAPALILPISTAKPDLRRCRILSG